MINLSILKEMDRITAMSMMTLVVILRVESSKMTVRKNYVYSWVWDDSGSGADSDVSIWKPILNSGEAYVSMISVESHDNPSVFGEVSYVITDYSEDALQEPASWSRLWCDSGSGAHDDVCFYRPNPADDYVCFGDFASESDWGEYGTTATWDGYNCVHQDWVNDAAATPEQVWDDAGSGAHEDGATWKISVSGYPFTYYHFSNGHSYGSNTDFYTFIDYYADCEVLSVNVDYDASIQVLGSIVDYFEALEVTNEKATDAVASTLSEQKCETTTSSFTYTHGYEVTVGVEYSVSRTVDASWKVFTASATASWTLSFSATVSEEWSETETVSSEICTEKASSDYVCPGRTTCKQTFTAYEAPSTEIPMNITLKCGANKDELEWVGGTFTATGVSNIIVTDSQVPLDCIYYTDDNYDRGNGLLPFCDTCSSSAECHICRDYYVLLEGECVSDQICEEACGGSIKGSGVSDTGLTPFSGAYCYGEDLSMKTCAAALNKVFNSTVFMDPDYEEDESEEDASEEDEVTIEWDKVSDPMSVPFYIATAIAAVLFIILCSIGCYCCCRSKSPSYTAVPHATAASV